MSDASSAMRFGSRRSAVLCTHACVATSQPAASRVALQILDAGGNAADAAVAAAAALNCTEPCMTGIGGDAFCLFWDAKAGKMFGLNGSGRAPAALDREAALAAGACASGGEWMDPNSVHAVTVPGAAAAWADTVAKFGNLTLEQVLAPAVELAEGGYAIHAVAARTWQESEYQLTRWGEMNEGVDALLPGEGRTAPREGDWMCNPDLAATFRELAQHGKDGFYRGRVAKAVEGVINAHGGKITLQDLSEHTSTFDEPISAEFEGHTVWELPPNGQGLVSLLALQTLSKLPQLKAAGHNSADYLHLIAESLRMAFADGAAHVCDASHPDAARAKTVAELLSPAHAAACAAAIRTDATMADAAGWAGVPWASETVYLTAVDAEGNACSFINSNYMGFGSGLVPKGCGFSLQNRGANFSLKAGHPNVLAPRKRPYHTIIPAMLTKAGELVASLGVMGGFMQPQGHVQVLLNMLLHKMDPQAALDAPRLCIEPLPPVCSLQQTQAADCTRVELALEEGIAEEVADSLRLRGHNVRHPVSGNHRRLFGKGQVILVRRGGRVPAGKRVLWGGSDPRGDGLAIGY